MLYWDWNATTPPHPLVIQAVADAMAEGWGNPASVHQVGRRASRLVERTRVSLAERLSLSPRDLVFCSSGTEANNLALQGAGVVVLSRLEHPSLVRRAEALERAGARVIWLPVPPTGRLEPSALRDSLRGLEATRAVVVAVSAANHETGVLQPVTELLEVVRHHGARLHVDLAQCLGKSPIDSCVGADSYTVVAHKVRGPQGIAAFAWRAGFPPSALLSGGGQERGLRPGTVPVPLVVGFGAALELLEPAEYARIEPLRDELERRLSSLIQINGRGVPRLPHVSNFSTSGWTGERLVAALDMRGLCVSSGSACSAGSTEPSPVITAMLGQQRAQSALRVSLGPSATWSELDEGVLCLESLLRRTLAARL